MAAILEQNGLVDRVDLIRLDVGRRLDPAHRAAMGQFFTPAPIARFMANLAKPRAGHVRLLDPGAGVGSLSAAWITRACTLDQRLPSSYWSTTIRVVECHRDSTANYTGPFG
jgi:adenine-specific DNA-methyltransferase